MHKTQFHIADTSKAPQQDETILAEGVAYPHDDILSGVNDNVLVVGGSGTGKTRSVVRPNLLQASGSYVVSDPKGNLYDLYAPYLRAKGYRVERLDFNDPLRSTVYYNFFRYLESETDVYKAAFTLSDVKGPGDPKDRFWDDSAMMLMQAIICLLREEGREDRQNLSMVNHLIRQGERTSNGCMLDDLMERHVRFHPDSRVMKYYKATSLNPDRTWACVLTSALIKYGAYETKELSWLMQRDTLAIDTIGDQPTAIFVVVSDTDRSMDVLANLFFTQALQVVCRVADARPDGRLQIPVRFILDDFATNVRITEFPRMIATIRSRGISAMLMVQTEAQLRAGYEEDAGTIIGNCDTYVYLGGNDLNTAYHISARCDRPVLEILNAPLRDCWVFRRGQEPIRTRTFDLEPFEAARMAEMQGQMADIIEPDPIRADYDREEARKARFAAYEDETLGGEWVEDDDVVVVDEDDDADAATSDAGGISLDEMIRHALDDAGDDTADAYTDEDGTED